METNTFWGNFWETLRDHIRRHHKPVDCGGYDITDKLIYGTTVRMEKPEEDNESSD